MELKIHTNHPGSMEISYPALTLDGDGDSCEVILRFTETHIQVSHFDIPAGMVDYQELITPEQLLNLLRHKN